MKGQIPVPVAIAVVAVIVAAIAWFGWRKAAGADNDATQANIERYKALAEGRTKAPANPKPNPAAPSQVH